MLYAGQHCSAAIKSIAMVCRYWDRFAAAHNYNNTFLHFGWGESVVLCCTHSSDAVTCRAWGRKQTFTQVKDQQFAAFFAPELAVFTITRAMPRAFCPTWAEREREHSPKKTQNLTVQFSLLTQTAQTITRMQPKKKLKQLVRKPYFALIKEIVAWW